MKNITLKRAAQCAGTATAAVLLAGAVTPTAQALPRKPLPPGITTRCEGQLVYQDGDSLRIRRLSDTKFCAYVTKAYFETPFKAFAWLGEVYISTGAYTTQAKSSWGKYVYIPVGQCVSTWSGTYYPSGSGWTGPSKKFCNVS